MISIYNFLFKLLNIVPSWSESTISGIYMTLLYLSGFLILSMVLYFILRAISKKNLTFVPKFTLSLSFTIASFLAFLVSTVFFILFWTSWWMPWEYFDLYIPELPLFLIPFSFFLCLFLSFLIWFLLEKRKRSADKVSVT